jgi:hypothetical protein
MSPTFVGPTTPGAAYRGSSPAAAALFRHYGTVTEGVNVYILTNGTVTTQDPVDPSAVAHTLWGGHVEPITAAEATLLTTAGYGAFIT